MPGNRPERFAKALASGADALILDLEDSVPLGEQVAARAAVVEWLTATQPSLPVWVRVNALGHTLQPDDLQIL